MLIRLYDHLIHLYPWQIYALAFLCFLPAVLSPFYSDDFFHLLLIENYLSSSSEQVFLDRTMPGSILGLFAFVDDVPANIAQLRQFSLLPWWSANDFHFRFWRPLAELSHIIDYVILPRSSAFSHLHNIALFFVGAFLLQKLLKVLSVKSALTSSQAHTFCALAIIIYLLDGQHVATVSWVANRNALLAGIFSLLAMLQFISWIEALESPRELHQFRLRPLKSIALALLYWAAALLSSEAALAMAGYFFAFIAVYSHMPWWRRVLSLLPLLLLSLLWLGFHQWLGYGAEPQGNSYVNPLSHPGMFLSTLLERVPVYWFANISSTPAGAYWTLGNSLPAFKTIYSILAIAVTLTLLWLVRGYVVQSRLMRFALIAFACAAVPASLANPQDRLALFLSFASAIFFAVLLQMLFQQLSAQHSKRLYFSFVCVLSLQVIISPLHLLLGGSYMRYEALMINQQLRDFDAQASIQDKRIVLLNIPLGYHVMMLGVRQYYDKALPKSSFYLGNDAGALSFEAINKRQFIVSREPAFATGHERHFRSLENQAFQPGETNLQAGIKSEVLALDERGYPYKLMLSLQDSVEEYQFYAWQNGKIVAVAMPSQSPH